MLEEFGYVSILLTSVALYVAVRNHSSGFRAGAALALLHVLLAGLSVGVSVHAVLGTSRYADVPLWMGLAWSVATMSAVGATIASGFRMRRSKGELEKNMTRRALGAWVILASLEGATLFMIFDRGNDSILLWVYAVTPVVFGIGALRLVKGHRMDGDIVRAELARLFGLFGLLLVPFGFLGLLAGFGGAPSFFVGYLAAIAAFMLFLPVTTVVLGGFRSPPFDLVRRPLTKEQSERRVTLSLVALGGVASLVIALSFAKHFGSCGGVLIEVPEPKTAWRALPIIARGDEKYSLGPFNVRGHKDNYKGYPSVIQQATLSDPRLCFASTVSLEPWFDGRYGYHLYRRADELELRHDPKTHTFVVTGNGYPTSDVRTGFVVAFRRDETKRYWFDRPEAASHQLFAIGFLCIGGVSLALFRLRDDRPRGEFAFLKRDYRWMYPRVAYLAFLVAFASPLVLAFQLIEAPRPGAELVIHVIPP